MKNQTSFGGEWTEDKLGKLKKYLSAYMKIFTTNPKAKFLTTIYVDGFAGSGVVQTRSKKNESLIKLFPELQEEETVSLIKGSAKIALETIPPFDKYIFIDSNKSQTDELMKLKDNYSLLSDRINIVNQDTNIWLKDWCNKINWERTRSVVFLDPWGMQVDWSLLVSLGKTKGIDLWLLFPLGVAVNRMFTRNSPPPKVWADLLTKTLGTKEWEQYFYPKQTINTLFGDEEIQIKDADFDSISEFIVKRLKTIFHDVAPNPLPLRNSKNIPIYLLCFASANPKGSNTAIKIAQNILKN